MNRILWLLVLLVGLTMLLPQTAYANGSMRCGTHVIAGGMRDGPDKYEVLKKCGEPEVRGVFTWTYRMPNGTSRVVHFDHSGRLSRIEQGSSNR